MSLIATRAPIRTLPGGHYACTRCGIVKEYNPSRPKPNRCADCRSIECDKGHPYGENPPMRRGKRECPTCKAEGQARTTANRRARREAERAAAAVEKPDSLSFPSRTMGNGAARAATRTAPDPHSATRKRLP